MPAHYYPPAEVADRGLPVDLVEPCPARAEGDRVPCHLFMPEVAWLVPFPVLRPRPRREVWLQSRQPWPVEPSTDLLEPPGFGRVVAVVVGSWLCAALLGSFAMLRWL